jgi:WD40 repeat protein
MIHPKRFSSLIGAPVFVALLLLRPAALRAQEDKAKTSAPKPPVPEMQPLRALEGHVADLYHVEFSPDATKIATGSFDKTIRLWETSSGKLIAVLSGHQGKVLSVTFSQDGRSLLSASDDKTIKLWDVPGEGSSVLAGHAGPVEAISLSPDGNWLSSGADDGTVRLWNRASGKEVLKLEGHGSPVRCLAFSADGKRLASGGDDKTARLWDISHLVAPPPPPPAAGLKEIVKQGAPWRYFKGKAEPPAEWKAPKFDDSKWEAGPSGFGYSSTPEELAPVGTKLEDMMNSYTSLYIRDAFQLEDPKELEKLTLRVIIDDAFVAYLDGQEVGRHNIEGSPPPFDSTTASSIESTPIDLDLTPHLAKLEAGNHVLAIQGHNRGADSSDFVLAPVLSGVFKAKAPPPKAEAPKVDLAKLEGASGPVLAVAWSPDGSLVAGGGADKSLYVWKTSAAAPPEKKLDQGGIVRGLAFLDGNVVAAAGEGGAIKLWSLSDGKVTKTLEGHQGNVLALALRLDRAQLLSGGEDKTVRLWDVPDSKEVRSLIGHEGPVMAVAFSPDGKTLISGSGDKTVRAWNAADGKEMRKFLEPGEIRGVAGGVDERYFASASTNDVLEWRNVSTEALKTFSGHGGRVQAAIFSPDGATVASAGEDKTVRFWNRADAKELRSINAHESTVYTLAYSPDGQFLASGGLDKTVKIWKTADGTEVKKLQGHGEGVFCLRYSLDGQFVYSGSSDRTIRKWSVADGKEVALLDGHEGWVCGIALFPGETRLASVDFGGDLIVWSLADAKIVSRRRVPRVTYDFALSRDGKLAATTKEQKALVFEMEGK